MEIHDVSGYRLDNALETLKSQEFEKILIKLTASPRLRDTSYDGNSRIVRQNILDDGTLELLVCNINS